MNFIKTVVFIFIFGIIYYILSYISLPSANIEKYGMYKTSLYEILGEKKDTVDVVVLGDSLVYSSISPMDIYEKYGYTIFNCAEPAQIISDTYKYYEVAIDNQHPKVVIIGANIFFRNGEKKPYYVELQKVLKNNMPLIIYHDNWKKAFLPKEGRVNVEKGYRINEAIKPAKNNDYMRKNKEKALIPSVNLKYFEKMVESAKKENIKLVLVGLPSQKSWNYSRHNAIKKISRKYNVEYINMNLMNLDIDWTIDTKDKGSHLNYQGAKKSSAFFAEYLHNLGILNDHRHDPRYSDWNKSLKLHRRSLINK